MGVGVTLLIPGVAAVAAAETLHFLEWFHVW